MEKVERIGRTLCKRYFFGGGPCQSKKRETRRNKERRKDNDEQKQVKRNEKKNGTLFAAGKIPNSSGEKVADHLQTHDTTNIKYHIRIHLNIVLFRSGALMKW